MNIQFWGDISSFGEGFYDVLKDLGVEAGESNYVISLHRSEQGFSVTVSGEKAELSYCQAPDFYRGLSIAVDAFRNQYEVSLSQTPAFEICGIMLDVSRGAVLKVARVKDLLRRLARMGFNEMLLYTEDTYELKEYPYFGYMRGRYTEEELKEIVSYGDLLGVEIVPCIQTLGHLASPLRWQSFGEVRDQSDVLLIDEEKTYQLIETMIQTVRRIFTTNRIHIGMDEAHGVGLGKYYEKHGPEDRFTILTRHLGKVMSICKQYDFEPMMWSDMFFRLGTKNGDYYSFDVNMPENIADMIPDGISQVYWDYYNNSENMYHVMIQEHNKMGCPIVFAGGTWTWSAPSVNLRHSFESAIPALKVCKEQGIRHVLATLWSDDGCECDVYQALYPLQYYAEYQYNPEHAMEQLDKMFQICNGFDANAFRLLDIDDFGQPFFCPEGNGYEDYIVNTSKQALYQNPLIGLFDVNFSELDLHTHYAEIYEKISCLSVPKEVDTMFEVHKQLVKVLVSKCDIGIRTKKAYDADDKSALELLAKEFSVLEGEVRKLRELRLKLWFENNKPFGYELLTMRLTTLESFVKIASERLRAYLAGETERLEELEEERLPYNGQENPLFTEYWASRIQMPIIWLR